MSLLGEQTLTRRRYDGGAWTAGRWVAGASTDTDFLGSVHRLTGAVRASLPEGDRTRTARRVLTEQLGFLRTEDQFAGVEADEVLINGTAYRVVFLGDEHPEIPYNEVHLVRVQETSPTAEVGIEVDLADAARAWMVAFGADGGIPNADRAVIIAHENGPRPPLPYIVVHVEALNERVGYDAQLTNAAGETAPQGIREGVIAFEGFGRGAEVWIETASFLLHSPASRAALTALDLEPRGPLLDLSELVDTDQERQVRQEFAFTYRRLPDTADKVEGTELGQVVHTDVIGDGTNNRTIVVTEDLTP